MPTLFVVVYAYIAGICISLHCWYLHIPLSLALTCDYIAGIYICLHCWYLYVPLSLVYMYAHTVGIYTCWHLYILTLLVFMLAYILTVTSSSTCPKISHIICC